MVCCRYGPPGFGPRRDLGGSWLHQRRVGRGVWVFRHDRFADLDDLRRDRDHHFISHVHVRQLVRRRRRHSRLAQPDRRRRAITRNRTTPKARLTGSIPSPMFFNRPRTLDEAGPGLERKETAAHLNIGWVMPFSDEVRRDGLRRSVVLPPEQDVVSDVDARRSRRRRSRRSAATITTTEQEERDRLQRRRGRDLHRVAERQRPPRRGRLRALHAGVDGRRDAEHAQQPTDVGGMQFGFGARLRF